MTMMPLSLGTCEHSKLKFANSPVWDIVMGNREKKLWDGGSPNNQETDIRGASGEFPGILSASGGGWISPV